MSFLFFYFRFISLIIFIQTILFSSNLFAQKDLENAKSEEELIQFINFVAPSEDAFVAVQLLAKKFIDKKDWVGAEKIFNKYRSYFPLLSDRFDKIISLISKPPQNLTITNLGSNINTTADEYFPVISIDGNSLYFTGNDRIDCIKGEDIFFSQKKDAIWMLAKNMGKPFCTKEDDAVNSISADGNTLVIFGNYKGAFGGGDNFFVEKLFTGWSSIKPFPSHLNSKAWECDGFLTSDGKAFLFTSDRKGNIGEFHIGGYFFHGYYEGNSDIYVSIKIINGWSEPVNLGLIINTPYTERSPFLHPDGKTMYFSSDGLYGLGGLDVFKTTRLSDTSWTEWSEPVNLGKGINTSGFDIAYKITTDGKMAYFSSNMPGGIGGYDIYTVNLPEEAKPERNVVTIKGKVTDENLNPLDADVKWLDINSGNNVGSLKSDPVTGDYIITLPVGKIYSYFADKNGYYSASNEINLSEVKEYGELNVDIVLYSIQNLIEVKKTIRINNIYFDFDKFELKSESFPELDRLVSFLQINPGLKIEIMAHTDSKGSDGYNINLSQNRANSVTSYLIEKGIDGNRLVATGYGESMPISDNETEEGRALNRRVEMKLHY